MPAFRQLLVFRQHYLADVKTEFVSGRQVRRVLLRQARFYRIGDDAMIDASSRGGMVRERELGGGTRGCRDMAIVEATR